MLGGTPIKPKQVLVGSEFSEPMRVESVSPVGDSTWTLGLVGLTTEKFRSATLSAAEIASLAIQDATCSYAGGSVRGFRIR